MIMNNEKFLSTLKTCKGDEELDEVLVEHALHDRDHNHLGTIVIMMTLMVIMMTLMVTRMTLMVTKMRLMVTRMTMITLTLMTLTLMTISARMTLTPKTPQSEMRIMEAVAANQILQQYYLW